MGCNSSTPVKKASSSNYDFSRRNTIVSRPDVPVEIGNGVKKLNAENRVVFIFGEFLPFKVSFLLQRTIEWAAEQRWDFFEY